MDKIRHLINKAKRTLQPTKEARWCAIMGKEGRYYTIVDLWYNRGFDRLDNDFDTYDEADRYIDEMIDEFPRTDGGDVTILVDIPEMWKD